MGSEVGLHSSFSTHHSSLPYSSAARDRRHDAQLVAGLDRGLELLEVADVLVVEVDVDEPVELVRALEQARLDAGGLGLEAVEHRGDGAAVGLDDVGAVGEVTQGGRDADANAHGWMPFLFSVCLRTGLPGGLLWRGAVVGRAGGVAGERADAGGV